MARVLVEKRVRVRDIENMFALFKKHWAMAYKSFYLNRMSAYERKGLREIAKHCNLDEFGNRAKNYLQRKTEFLMERKHPLGLLIYNFNQYGGSNGTGKKQESGICRHDSFDVQAELRKNRRRQSR